MQSCNNKQKVYNEPGLKDSIPIIGTYRINLTSWSLSSKCGTSEDKDAVLSAYIEGLRFNVDKEVKAASNGIIYLLLFVDRLSRTMQSCV